MHTVDVIAVCVALLFILLCAGVLARQRYMLRVQGGIPMAVHARGNRWLYGIGRYVGDELRWYRAIGVGTRPTSVLHRTEMHIVGRRAPVPAETSSIPASSVVVEISEGGRTTTLALSEGAFTGFQSWLEASAPMH